MEPWWVENPEGYAFTATGVRLVLGLGASGEVIIARRESCAEGPGIVLGWLQALAQVALESRQQLARDGKVVLSRAEEEGALPETPEGLLAYIGLPWTAPRDWFTHGCLLLLVAIAALLAAILYRLL